MQDELSFSRIAENVGAAPSSIDSDDLWPRIAAAHVARRRKRARRFSAGLATTCFIAALALGMGLSRKSPSVDWQARAQALEMQLDETTDPSRSSVFTTDTEQELVRIDRALQAGYDRGAGKNELLPLWKQRSELLSVLLAVRQQQLALTRI